MESVLAIFDVRGDTQELLAAYDRAIPELQRAAGELGTPAFHACCPADNGITIVDVWESGEALQRFSEHPRFGEILVEAGLPEPTAVTVLPVHAQGWPAEAPASV